MGRSHSSRGTQWGSIGRYKLLHRIAIGGMGEIFLARETGVAGFDRLVAVKRLIPELAERPEMVELFVDEARIAAHLAHPNVVHVHELGSDEGAFFLSMEYVPGQNLARVVERAARVGEKIPRPIALYIMGEIVAGLEHAHTATDAEGKSLAIVHRDISPQNALISYGGVVKLTDFGIAKADNAFHRTETGVIRGKLSYMAPEQVRGEQVDTRADVFSVGVMLWELTLGERLFDGPNAIETARLVENPVIALPSEIDSDYPPQLEHIVMTALAPDRENRFPSATELAGALRAYASWDEPATRADLSEWMQNMFSTEVGETRDLVADSSEDGTQALDVTGELKAALAPTEMSASSELLPEGHSAQLLPAEVTDLGEAATHTELVRTRRPIRYLVIGSIALLAAAGGGFLYARSLVRDNQAVTAAAADAGVAVAAAPLVPPAALDAGALVVAVDGAVEIAAPVPERTARPTTRRRRRKPIRVTGGQPKAPAPTRPETVPSPPPITPPAVVNGKLLVASEPWGDVTINGRSAGQTSLMESLEPGTYRVVVNVSGQKGRFSARAVVESGKRTKCRVVGAALRCGSPR